MTGFFFYFISCSCMFVLGVLVGRGTSPVSFDIKSLEAELLSLSEKDQPRPALHPPQSTAKDVSKLDLEFFEALKNASTDTQLKSPIVKPKPVQKDTARQTKRSPSPSETARPAPTVPTKRSLKKETAAPSIANPKPHKPKITSPPPSPKKKLTLQVAAFKKAKDAEKMVKKLTHKGYSAYKTIGKTKDNTIWYRVRIGAFENRAQARQTQDRLKKDKIQSIVLNK